MVAFSLPHWIARLTLPLFLALEPFSVRAESLTVFAAASTGSALAEIADDWQAETGHDVVLSLAGTSSLARQIAAGAPADVFLSANRDWIDSLQADGRIVADSRVDLLGNTLVLIGGPAAEDVDLGAPLELATRLGEGPLAMALVDAVPAGIYGKAALVALGAWEGVAPRVAQADNVRAALALVAAGAAPMGIVYASDAAAEPRVRIIAHIPPETHPPIVYPAAAVAGGKEDLARAFLAHLQSAPARAAFERHGFRPPGG